MVTVAKVACDLVGVGCCVAGAYAVLFRFELFVGLEFACFGFWLPVVSSCRGYFVGVFCLLVEYSGMFAVG